MNDMGTPSRASKAILTLLSALGIALVGAMALLARSQWRSLPTSRHRHRSLERFRQAILNNTRQNVAAVLGPPHAAIMIQAGPEGPATTAHNWWQADTWYYPLNRRRRAALAIRFQNHQAREVHIIHTPR